MIEIETFEEFSNHKHLKQLVIVSATWCGPCKIIKKELKNYLETHKMLDSNILLIDYDKMQEDEELHNYFNTQKLPTFYQMEHGNIQQYMTTGQWDKVREFIEENYYVESKLYEKMVSDDF